MVTVEIPSEYGYVVLTAVSTVFLAIWHGIRVGAFRKNAQIPYPYEYASWEQIQTAPPAKQNAMYIFNCAQRAHQNFNEHYPSALVMIMVAGIKYPVATTARGFSGRLIGSYAVGYTKAEEKGERKGGKGRYYGVGWNLAHFGLAGLSLKTGYDMIMS